MSSKVYKSVAAATLLIGGGLILKRSCYKRSNEVQPQIAKPVEQTSVAKPLDTKNLVEKKPEDIIKLEFKEFVKPLEQWKYVPLKTTSGDYLHYFNPARTNHQDYTVTVKIPHLKQHSKYPRVLKTNNLCSVSSNRPADIEILTFHEAKEEIGDNALIKKAHRLIDMERRLKNGERLKPSDWSSPSKDELHKDAKVNAVFLKIPK